MGNLYSLFIVFIYMFACGALGSVINYFNLRRFQMGKSYNI
ncbi:hypothetical protein GGR08_000026 [Bartonella fuyuanensis]|uniref:Uncharacterized protein n=1 Tax=Bartonella fuyuanensis TaxID=1460968 RepID=A0A840DW07_9HYPH|nr:hypothetical protein [Bartonella fuyuanensis]